MIGIARAEYMFLIAEARNPEYYLDTLPPDGTNKTRPKAWVYMMTAAVDRNSTIGNRAVFEIPCILKEIFSP